MFNLGAWIYVKSASIQQDLSRLFCRWLISTITEQRQTTMGQKDSELHCRLDLIQTHLLTMSLTPKPRYLTGAGGGGPCRRGDIAGPQSTIHNQC